MSLNGTEYSCWASAWASYRIVQSPAVCLRYLSSSSVTVYSLIPISNFSKCASITCWTKTQKNTVIYGCENRRGNNSSLSIDTAWYLFSNFHLLVKNRKMPKICCVVGGTINRLKNQELCFCNPLSLHRQEWIQAISIRRKKRKTGILTLNMPNLCVQKAFWFVIKSINILLKVRFCWQKCFFLQVGHWRGFQIHYQMVLSMILPAR